MTGFYTGVYARYASTKYATNYTHVADGKAYPILASAQGNSVGAGVLIGAQFPISARVMLDWWIAGASVNRTTLHLSGRADISEISQEDRVAVEDALESDNLYNGAFDVTIHNNGGNAHGTVTTPGFRTGLCIGVRF
jgi:hypothetical protein